MQTIQPSLSMLSAASLRFGFASLSACAVLGALPILAQNADDDPDDFPVQELNELTVRASTTDWAPDFDGKTPQLSYYKSPELRRGELILALEFMDQYRDATVPGPHKWSGMLHFPVIDGREGTHLKWICLYFYDGRMWGYDPSATLEYQKRFTVPISYEGRLDRKVLVNFATSYVESIYPAQTEEIYLYENEVDPLDPDAIFMDTYETLDIPAGRIAPVLESQKKKTTEELVRLIYQYAEDPNPGAQSLAAMGPAEDFGKSDFSWEGFKDRLTGYQDSIEIARELVAPRWSYRIRFLYTKNLFLLPDYEAKASALLFNIGNRIYCYSSRYGVWRTKATLDDLENSSLLVSKLEYPGVDAINGVEFIPYRPKPKTKPSKGD